MVEAASKQPSRHTLGDRSGRSNEWDYGSYDEMLRGALQCARLLVGVLEQARPEQAGEARGERHKRRGRSLAVRHLKQPWRRTLPLVQGTAGFYARQR